MFLSINLDKNMQKNFLFFGKKQKITETLAAPNPPLASGSWGLRPQTPELLPLSSVTVTFEEGVCSANVIAVQKEQKELRNTDSNNVLRFPLISYFKLYAGYKLHWLRFLSIATITTYVFSYLSKD